MAAQALGAGHRGRGGHGPRAVEAGGEPRRGPRQPKGGRSRRPRAGLDRLAWGRPGRGRGRARVRAGRGFPARAHGRAISMPGMYVEDSAPMPIGDMWLKNITLFSGRGQHPGPHGRGDRADPPWPARSEGDHLPPAPALRGGQGIRAVRSERGAEGRVGPERIAPRRRRDARRPDAGRLPADPEARARPHARSVRGRGGGDAHATAARRALPMARSPSASTRSRAALESLGVERGDRVATFMWNSQPHLELYMAAPCMGAVLHMLNIRLFEEQLTYIANHAKDKVVFVDDSLVPLLAKVAPSFETVEHYVVVGDGDAEPAPERDPLRGAARRARRRATTTRSSTSAPPPASATRAARPATRRACSTRTARTCSTALRRGLADTIGITASDRVLPVVPMFHVNAWGFPYACAMVGADLVMPGRFLQPEPLAKLIESERVTIAGAVPTIWMGLLQCADEHKPDLSSLRSVICGGAAVPESLMRALRGAPRREDHAGVGHDGDQPDRRGRAAAGGRRGRGALALPHRHRPDRAARRRAPDGRRRRGAVGRRVHRRGRGARPLDRARLLRGPVRRRQVPRRLAAHGRRRLDRPAGDSCGSPTAPRT